MKPATLTSSLVAKKGEAAPATVAVTAPAAPEPVKPKVQAKVRAPEPVPEAQGGVAYWKAMTLKLDRERFTALKKIGVDLNKTSQNILVEALDLWLEKHTPKG